jgi:hypothetical protein
MAKRTRKQTSVTGAAVAKVSRRRGRTAKNAKDARGAAGADTLDSDVTDVFDSDEQGWEMPLPEKDEPRIRRQMAARRKLEVYREAKQLEELISDWCFVEQGTGFDRV